jgi:hypothetical protein
MSDFIGKVGLRERGRREGGLGKPRGRRRAGRGKGKGRSRQDRKGQE